MLNPTPSNPNLDVYQPCGSPHDLQGESLRTLFEGKEANLLRYAYSLTGRRAVAEEIVQDAFLKLHTIWDEVKQPEAWLYRHVRNRCLNHLRKSKRETLECDDERAKCHTYMDEQPAGSSMTGMETAVQLRKALEQLPMSDRQLICLKYFEGRKYREISELTGLSVGNVGYRLHQIMQHLAGQLRPLGIDETK